MFPRCKDRALVLIVFPCKFIQNKTSSRISHFLVDINHSLPCLTRTITIMMKILLLLLLLLLSVRKCFFNPAIYLSLLKKYKWWIYEMSCMKFVVPVTCLLTCVQPSDNITFNGLLFPSLVCQVIKTHSQLLDLEIKTCFVAPPSK